MPSVDIFEKYVEIKSEIKDFIRSKYSGIENKKCVAVHYRGSDFKDFMQHIFPRGLQTDEEYYKIQLGVLEKLPDPILAKKWKRLTFLYTTGEYLLQAKTLNDLVVQNDERKLLWKSLRERAENSALYKADLPDVEIDPMLLTALLGIRE